MEAGSSASTTQVGPQEEVESWGPLPLGENLYSASLPICVAVQSVVSASQAGRNSASNSLSTSTSESNSPRSQTIGSSHLQFTGTLAYQNALFLSHLQSAQSVVSSQSFAHSASFSVSTARSGLSNPSSSGSYAVYSSNSCGQMYSADGATIESDTSLALVYSADGATIESDTSLALADQNALFLSNMQTARSLPDSMSVPSVELMVVRNQRTPSPRLHTSQPSNTAHATAVYSAFSEGSGSRLNSNATTTTTTITFPTVTHTSRNSTAQRIEGSPYACATYDASGADATSIVSIPSQVLPDPTTLENAVSGLTTAMPTRFMIGRSQDEAGDSPSYDDDDDDDDDNLLRNVAMLTTSSLARTTTSSSLTTLSTTMANHAFHYEHSRSLLALAGGGVEGGHQSSSTGSSSAITIHSTQRQRLAATNIDDTLAAAVIQADEDVKMKAASEFIPPAAAAASRPRSPGGETLLELEDMILAKRGASSLGLPPRRHQSFGTQQRLLEKKLAGTNSPSESSLDPNRLLEGNNLLPVVQEQSILEELDALNRSTSQEDCYRVARRRATFVLPGAYHQAPGQVAIRRARSRADSLQGGTVDGSTTSGTTASFLRLTSNATNVSHVSSIGMASHNYENGDGMPDAIDLPVANTRRHTYSAGSMGSGDFPVGLNAEYDDFSFVTPESHASSTASSASASSAPPIGAPAMSTLMSASSSAEAHRSQNQSTNTSFTTSSTLQSSNHGHRSRTNAGTSPQREEDRPRDEGDQEDPSHSGLVHAHPVQPSAAIVNADPVFPLDQTRRRGLVEEGVDMRQTIKLPFSQSSLLMVVLACIVLFLGAVVAVTMLVTIGRNDSSIATNDNGRPTASPDTFVPTTQRGMLIQQRLEVEFGIREESNKDDYPKNSTPGNGMPSNLSPYSNAMHWLVNMDPMALDPSADNLLQRYLMAYFYFHTSEERPWVSCNPSTGQEDKFCSYRYVKPFDEEDDESPYNIRWLSNEHECDWAGVYCESFTIIELSLNGYNLSGTFPKQISKLRNLSILSLRDNGFSGSLPSELWELSSLRVVRLNGNAFTGGWPSSWSVLTSLSFIDVAHNSLTGSLPDLNLFLFSNLENLWVDHNRFTGTIPMHLSSGSKLKQLFLNDNNLVGPLPNIGNLTSLEYFDVSGNKITGSLPSEIGLLTKLRDLVISSTHLQGTIPKELYGLSNLQDVILSRSNFTGTMSERIGELTQLETLMLDGNSFFGFLPSELGRLSSLIHVELQYNDFVGTISESMCRLKGPHTLTVLIADCTPTSNEDADSEGKIIEPPRVSCPDDCCSSCCDPGTQICVPN